MKACLSCAPRDFVSPHRVYNHITITRIADPRPRPARGNSSHHPLRARERTSHGLSPKTEYEVRSCRAYGGHVRQVAKLAATAAEISALWRLVNQQGLAVQCLCSTLFHRTRRLGSLSLLSAARLFRNPLLINSGHTLARCRPFLPLPLGLRQLLKLAEKNIRLLGGDNLVSRGFCAVVRRVVRYRCLRSSSRSIGPTGMLQLRKTRSVARREILKSS